METPENILNVSGDCFDYVRVSSYGLWNEIPRESILQHSLFRLHVQLLLIFLLIHSFHFVLKRFHFSRLTSEILAGIVLGPTVMENVDKSSLFFPTPNVVFASLSKIGYIIFLFLTGVRMDPSLVRKTGKIAFILAVLSFLFQQMMVLSLDVKFNEKNVRVVSKSGIESFVGLYFVSVTNTEFVMVSAMLMQLKIMNSQLGHLALASSLLCKLLSFAVGTLFGFANAIHSISGRIGIQVILYSLTFIVFTVVVLRKLVLIFIRRTPEGKPMEELYTTITIAMLFLMASMGDAAGLHYRYGPLIFGLVVPARSPLAEFLVAKLDSLASGFLLPLLAVFCSSKFNLWEFIEFYEQALYFKISFIGFIIKLLLTFIGAFSCKMPLRHAIAIAIILNAKGITEIAQFLSFGDIKERNTASGIFLILLLQAFQPLSVKKLYNPEDHYIGYKNKSIQYAAAADAELHILACAHGQEDAVAVMKLLAYSNPTKSSPLSVYGLCLEELVFSSIPLLINHQLGQKMSSSQRSRSQSIIDIFKYFKGQRTNSLIQINVFTAVSPLKQMHEDICWLSFDKACSLVILPFHKKYNSKGKIVSSNTNIRNLNISVLERAPCSVAILIDRSRTQGLGLSFTFNTSTCRLASLFLGGPDDREALSFALRMAGSLGVHLTVTHFTTPRNGIHETWDYVIDKEFLRNLRPEMSERTNIIYVQETVKDGNDTSSIIKSMVGGYDLIVVGRRHETEPQALTGLSEWTDLQELGPIADLLASEDITSPISILVVQQQIMKASHSSTLN